MSFEYYGGLSRVIIGSRPGDLGEAIPFELLWGLNVGYVL